MSDDWDEIPMPALSAKPAAAAAVSGWDNEPSSDTKAATNGSNWKEQSSFGESECD